MADTADRDGFGSTGYWGARSALNEIGGVTPQRSQKVTDFLEKPVFIRPIRKTAVSVFLVAVHFFWY